MVYGVCLVTTKAVFCTTSPDSSSNVRGPKCSILSICKVSSKWVRNFSNEERNIQLCILIMPYFPFSANRSSAICMKTENKSAFPSS